MRDELLASNEDVTWYPEHIKHGRFGNWLENNVDWALSRERYWGTPLPIWRAEDGEVVCVGSRDELRELGAEVPDDLHRPYIDDATFERDGKTLRRRARPDRRLVGLRLHALRAVARAVRERGRVRGALPGRLHLRGAGPDPGLVLLAARGVHAALRAKLLRDGALPRADPRPRGTEDVQVARATSWCPGTCSTPTARTRSAGTTSPRSSPGTDTASRSRRWASRCASS